MRCRKSPYSTVSHRPYYDDEPTILDPLKSLTDRGRSPTIRASGLAAHGVIASAAKPRDQAKRRDETDVPAKRRQAEALPRLSLADGHPQRPQGAEGATRQGPQAAGGVGEVEVQDGKARVGARSAVHFPTLPLYPDASIAHTRASKEAPKSALRACAADLAPSRFRRGVCAAECAGDRAAALGGRGSVPSGFRSAWPRGGEEGVAPRSGSQSSEAGDPRVVSPEPKAAGSGHRGAGGGAGPGHRGGCGSAVWRPAKAVGACATTLTAHLVR